MAGRAGGPLPPEGPEKPPEEARAKRPRPHPEASPGLPELFSPAFYEQVNKGPLEERYEAHNKDPKNWNAIPWSFILIGLLVGTIFAVVNVYAALTIGIVVGVSWYLIFFIGALLGWSPGRINYVGGASNGTSQIVIPIAFVLPALFLMTFEAQLIPGFGFYALDAIPSRWTLLGFFTVGGLLGVMFFLGYRHLWIVRRPLQYPGGFEAASQLLRMAKERTAGSASRIRQHVYVITTSGLIAALWVVLRDLKIFGPRVMPSGDVDRVGFLDQLFPGRWIYEGIVPEPWVNRPLYNGLVYLDPFLLAVGWFLRFRIAIVLVLGALVTFILPFLNPAAHAPHPGFPSDPASGLAALWGRNARLLAAAAILGAGLVALIRLRGPIREGFSMLVGGLGRPTDPQVESEDKKSRSLWVVVALVTALLLATVFLLIGGVPFWGVALVVPLSVLLVGLLGFIGVKITGETAIQPLSPMITIGFLFILVLLNFVGFSPGALLILALGAAAFFGAGIIMSTDVFLDTKVGHYIGNPPHRQAIVQAVGLFPGILVGTLLTWFLADMVAGEIARGESTSLDMPFANFFVGMSFLFLGDQIPWLLVGIAFLLGASVEYGTRLGTVFAIGMVLQLFLPVTILLGALAREVYERVWAPPEQGPGAEKALLARVAAPTGLFVGGSLAVLAVFIANQWLIPTP